MRNIVKSDLYNSIYDLIFHFFPDDIKKIYFLKSYELPEFVSFDTFNEYYHNLESDELFELDGDYQSV